ncbi:sensor histidine kinase [Lichenihabitans sp. PAMC28606]|uniref:sensor histidine kinase n=1 Tax=Lichenihabitans sp. PAMC28606 TaxID=2880932 RepID=UPI002221348F|nr:HAMP domain-containing sensor histidine kinase [Lichenihabitans sp. PAMC28606]
MESIIVEWNDFASSHVPAGANMSVSALRDHIVEILSFIADDLETPQTDTQQISKSQGDGPTESLYRQSAAEAHAALRLSNGFNIDQMVSEYRALRASVVKLWITKGLLSDSVDLTDLTRFNEAIDQAIAESVAEYTKLIDQSRNLFLGILGHDLRNPIGAASMAGDMLKRLSPPDSKERKLASQIVEASQRGIQILNDLLDITRSAFGSDIPISRSPMDLGQLSLQLVDEMQSLTADRHIKLSLDGDLKGAWDGARIGQVLSNLIGNAIHYSAPDTIITVALAGDPEKVTLSVHNEGAPIPAEQLDAIFEALTRGKSPDTSQYGSSHLGLGLYISKKIVAAHLGEIGVMSVAHGGTTFTAQLPR